MNFMAVVTIFSDFGAQKNKSATVSIVSPSIFHEVMGPDATIFVFSMLRFKQEEIHGKKQKQACVGTKGWEPTA